MTITVTVPVPYGMDLESLFGYLLLLLLLLRGESNLFRWLSGSKLFGPQAKCFMPGKNLTRSNMNKTGKVCGWSRDLYGKRKTRPSGHSPFKGKTQEGTRSHLFILCERKWPTLTKGGQNRWLRSRDNWRKHHLGVVVINVLFWFFFFLAFTSYSDPGPRVRMTLKHIISNGKSL